MPEEKFNVKKLLMALASAFLLILVLFFVLKSLNELDKRIYSSPDNLIIVVGGKGEIFAKPDIAQVSLSVEKEAVSLSDAQDQATGVINKVVDFLKGAGVEEKDIKTTNYNIYPRYDYLEQMGRVFRGYVVSQTIQVKIRKTDRIGEILVGTTKAGANQIGGIYFTIDDEEVVKQEARQKAIIDAQEKAGRLAKDLGLKIVRLVNFSESGGDYYLPYYAESKALGIGGGEEPDIPTGENKITVTVNLTYQMK